MLDFTPHLHLKTITALATRYGKPPAVVRPYVPLQVEQWGHVKRLDGGDLMAARAAVSRSSDARDATFVRVSGLREINDAEFQLLITLMVLSMSCWLTDSRISGTGHQILNLAPSTVSSSMFLSWMSLAIIP